MPDSRTAGPITPADLQAAFEAVRHHRPPPACPPHVTYAALLRSPHPCCLRCGAPLMPRPGTVGGPDRMGGPS